ncbi:MAG: PQQ-binding-like beta-propeller repeat protein [Candidatus Nitrosopolaris sp.]
MIGKQTLGISDKHSWKMFRGNSMRTGVSASRIPRKPSLLWVTEVGPTISSPIFVDETIYVSTITGRIFALNPSEKQIMAFECRKSYSLITFTPQWNSGSCYI